MCTKYFDLFSDVVHSLFTFFAYCLFFCFAHSGGRNNWELKERMGKLPNYVLHDLGVQKRQLLKTMPVRPVFYDRKEQNHRRQMKQLKQLAADDRRTAGVFQCMKCLQRGKYPGHIW